MLSRPAGAAAPEQRSNGRWTVVLLAAGAAVVIAYFAFGMPGMDHGGSASQSGSMTAMDHTSMSLDSEAFARRMASGNVLVINVHIPDAGTIEGTDLTIRYDRIVGDERLPRDKSAPILLYCRTGRMSAEAAAALMRAGYSDVAYLNGGIDAWKADGRSLA